MKKAIAGMFLMTLTTGCIGLNFPDPTQMMPYTMIDGGAQLGRDQLANRSIVANHFPLIKGMHQNSVLTVLGQPQTIDIIERDVSEDWYFTYYKRYKTAPQTDEGTLLVRLYNQKVIDVVNLK